MWYRPMGRAPSSFGCWRLVGWGHIRGCGGPLPSQRNINFGLTQWVPRGANSIPTDQWEGLHPWGRIFVGAGPLPSQEYHYGPTQWVPQGANGNGSIVPWVWSSTAPEKRLRAHIMAGPMRYGPMERAPSSFWWLGEDSRAGRLPTWISPTADVRIITTLILIGSNNRPDEVWD
ncbi:hypothetical protein BHE74_00029075 [Ensete ventricosum]|nr:hypothetical protein BHE74_00029075 [Ensete ventricosum]